MPMLLDVKDLRIAFETHEGDIDAVRGVSFSLDRGQALGIVGESGSGKSQTVLALMGLLAPNARVSGTATLQPEADDRKGQAIQLIGARSRLLRRIRGNRVAMIFQDPMTALNPHLRISTQMTELLCAHRGMSRRTAMKAAIDMLESVRIPDAAKRIRYYPHQFSGGMRQRVMIAMALSCEPEILIADEPTTALDVTVQAEILDVLGELRQRTNTALLLITHDLGVVAGQCRDVIVMRSGEVVERGDIERVFAEPEHDYTKNLLASIPRLDD